MLFNHYSSYQLHIATDLSNDSSGNYVWYLPSTSLHRFALYTQHSIRTDWVHMDLVVSPLVLASWTSQPDNKRWLVTQCIRADTSKQGKNMKCKIYHVKISLKRICVNT